MPASQPQSGPESRIRCHQNPPTIERVSGALILVVSLGLLVFYEPFVRFTGQWMIVGQ
jgi:hypothetical protein